MAQVTVRASASARQDQTTTLPYDVVPSKPTGTLQNDVMYAHVVIYANNTRSCATPSGWTLVDSTSSGNYYSYLFSLVAGASEPSTYTFTISGTAGGSSSACVVTITSLYNNSTSGPTDVHSVAVAGSGTSVTGTAITPTINPESLMLFFVGAGSSATSAISAYAVANNNPSWTELYEYATGAGPNYWSSQSMAYGQYAAVSTTGSPTATLSTSSANSVHMISVRVPNFNLSAPLATIAEGPFAPTTSINTALPLGTVALTAQVPAVAQADPKWTNQSKNSSTWANTQKS